MTPNFLSVSGRVLKFKKCYTEKNIICSCVSFHIHIQRSVSIHSVCRFQIPVTTCHVLIGLTCQRITRLLSCICQLQAIYCTDRRFMDAMLFWCIRTYLEYSIHHYLHRNCEISCRIFSGVVSWASINFPSVLKMRKFIESDVWNAFLRASYTNSYRGIGVGDENSIKLCRKNINDIKKYTKKIRFLSSSQSCCL